MHTEGASHGECTEMGIGGGLDGLHGESGLVIAVTVCRGGAL